METNGLSAAMSQFNVFGSQPISHTAQIGVSIEPESTVTQLEPATVCTINAAASYDFISAILIIFFNFVDEYIELCAVWSKDAGKFHQFCEQFCSDTVSNGTKSVRNIRSTLNHSDLVSKLRAETSAKSKLLEIVDRPTVR